VPSSLLPLPPQADKRAVHSNADSQRVKAFSFKRGPRDGLDARPLERRAHAIEDRQSLLRGYCLCVSALTHCKAKFLQRFNAERAA